jgi:ABC-type multidrug transport system ATPase subunit/ABC-type multidrug transport system permease subunit
MRELRVLTARNMKMFIRDPKALAGAWGGALAMAVVNGWVFMNMDRSEAGIRSREGSLWNATELYGYLILVNELYRMNVEIKFFDHERQDGITTSAGFLLSRRASKLLLEDLTIPPCFTLIYYFFAGYSHSARQFFIFLVMMWLSHFNAISFAGLSTAISRHFLLAGFLGNLYFTLQMVAAGYFIPSTQMPVYIGWLRWITHTFYTFGALAANEFIGAESPSGVGQFYDCPYSNNPSDPSCKQYTGAYIMESLGLPRDWIWKPVVILCVIAFICYLWAALILHYNPLKPVTRHVGERIERIDPPEIRFSPAPSPQAIAITLQKYGLKEKSQLSKRSSLLGPISTEFRPGRLTAVMGASGSGKTTLLSALSGRLATSTKARYQSIGSIMYNNTSLPEDKVRFVASFVNQDDVHLMPSLTVRETLQFVARLKLPDSLSREEKDARAEVMLRKFGLRHCADTLIGNSVTKGISGGEKRRVSIVCEILRTPDIVVLDEPTSGLDSFIALSVIEILHDLAKEGRTVILSIHQPTARMLRYFSDILVLGTEGLPVYSGPAQDMLRYFQNLGIECPHTMSPTDFVMDLATPDPGDNSGQQRVGYLVQRMKGNERLMKDVDISPSTSGSDGSVASGSVHLPTTSRNTFRKSFVLVLQRAAVNLSRQPILILARTLQLPGMAILLALFFAPLQKDYLAVQSRVGFVQQYACVGFVGETWIRAQKKCAFVFLTEKKTLGMIQSMATYPSERDVFYREASENLYGAESFMLQYTLLELPLEVFSCAIFALFTAYVTDLNPTVGQFGVSLLGAFGCLSSGESISIIFSTVISHSGAAISLTCALLGIFTVLGGVISLHVPPVLRALNHISPPKYAIASILNYSMKGLRFTCTDSQKKPDGSCLIGTGEEVLEMYNMTDELRWSLMGLVLCTLGYRLLAYVVLKLRSTWWLRK